MARRYKRRQEDFHEREIFSDDVLAEPVLHQGPPFNSRSPFRPNWLSLLGKVTRPKKRGKWTRDAPAREIAGAQRGAPEAISTVQYVVESIAGCVRDVRTRLALQTDIVRLPIN